MLRYLEFQSDGVVLYSGVCQGSTIGVLEIGVRATGDDADQDVSLNANMGRQIVTFLWLDRIKSAVLGHRTEVVAPPRFKASDSHKVVAKRTMRFLTRSGWTPLEMAPWAKVWIRAKKNGVVANIVVHQSGAGWNTLVRDAAETVSLLKTVVGIMTIGRISAAEKTGLARAGVYIIEPADLSELEAIIRAEMHRVAEARSKSGSVKQSVRV